jgi:hypothetical protein
MELIIDQERRVIVYNGVEYPPTVHNANCVRRYKDTRDEENLKMLRSVVLDI